MSLSQDAVLAPFTATGVRITPRLRRILRELVAFEFDATPHDDDNSTNTTPDKDEEAPSNALLAAWRSRAFPASVKEQTTTTTNKQKSRLSVEELRAVSAACLTMRRQQRRRGGDDDDFGECAGHLHELLAGARAYDAPVDDDATTDDYAVAADMVDAKAGWTAPAKDVDFALKLQRLRALAADREHEALRAATPALSSRASSSSSSSSSSSVNVASMFGTATRDLAFGVNVLAVMFTGFVVFFYAGMSLFPHNRTAHAVCGLAGFVAAMMLEATLFIVRDEAAHLRSKQLAVDAARAKATVERAAAATLFRGDDDKDDDDGVDKMAVTAPALAKALAVASAESKKTR
jgi:hypothetical protein